MEDKELSWATVLSHPGSVEAWLHLTATRVTDRDTPLQDLSTILSQLEKQVPPQKGKEGTLDF